MMPFERAQVKFTLELSISPVLQTLRNLMSIRSLERIQLAPWLGPIRGLIFPVVPHLRFLLNIS
jgi:hypothetical protein